MSQTPRTYAPSRPDPSLPPLRINLFSDTQTRASPGMLEAMTAAETGDEQMGADPTVWALCDRTAALLGQEAALFLPTGTMCNQLALLTLCRPGDEVLCHESAHIITSEGGAASALSGVMPTGLGGPRGQFGADTLRAAIRERSRYSPPQTVVSIEQTANLAGGTVWGLDTLAGVSDIARGAGMAVHMDGARLMNAAVASGVPAAAYGRLCDTVWLDFTKGLGAPLGAVLAGSAAFIGNAWRGKQRMGGAMRQAGHAAAACLYALDHNIDRLAEDHANARVLADGLRDIPGFAVEMPETNLVYADVRATGLTAAEVAAKARRSGVSVSVMGEYRVRACTHLDVSRADCTEAPRLVAASLG